MARSFDGSADYLSASSGLVSGYGHTLAAWVKPAAMSGTPIGFANSANATDRSGMLFNAGGEIQASTNSAGVTRTYRTTATASTGAWCHIAGSFDSSTVHKAWLNGDSAGSYTSTSAPAFPAINRTSISVLLRSTAASFFNGDIAEAGVWSVVLSNDEVQRLADGYSPLMVRPESLIAYWPLHGRGGAAGNEEDWVGTLPLTQTSSPALADHPRVIYPRRRTHVYVPGVAASAPSITALSAINITATSAQPQITYA